MNLCIPVTEDQGLSSPVSAHFGSAPVFLLVDTETGGTRGVANTNQHHAHGMCQPLAVLAGERFDALVTGGIGMGALQRLQAAGIRVYRAAQPTVAATLEALAAGELPEVTPAMACAGHGHHHGGR
jgi:predicted Fe-Mo cluster-binding NifX family protein